MKRLIFLSSLLIFSPCSYAAVDPKVHKICLEARDYSGCIKALQSTPLEVKSKAKKVTYFKREIPSFDDFTKETRVFSLSPGSNFAPDKNAKIQPCLKFLKGKKDKYHEEICSLTYDNLIKYRTDFINVPLSRNVINREIVLLNYYHKDTDQFVGYEIKQAAVDCKLKKSLERRLDYKFAKNPNLKNSKFIREKGYGKWEVEEADNYTLSTSCPDNPGYSRVNTSPNLIQEYNLEDINSNGNLKAIPEYIRIGESSIRKYFVANCKENTWASTKTLPAKEDTFEPISTYKHRSGANYLHKLACLGNKKGNWLSNIFSKNNQTPRKSQSDEEKAYFKSNSLVKLGRQKAESGSIDEAIADYTKAIEINPKNADAYIWRGFAKRMKGLARGDRQAGCSDWKKAADLGDEGAAGTLDGLCR